MPIHPTAFVDPTAQVPHNNDVGPYTRIGPGCVLGEGNVLMDGAVLGANTHVGNGNTFHYRCVVGHDPQYLGFNPATKSGTRIGDNNHFRELCTVHRALKDDTFTIIGNGNFIMAYAHVAHDCVLGNNVVMVNYSGISGHVEVGDRAFLSGHTAVHQFCRIGTLAMVGGAAAVSKDIPPFTTVKGAGNIIGLNVVGLRRAGVGAETRMALNRAYKTLFRSGSPISKSLASLRAEWDGREMPPELATLLDFCAAPSKRGLHTGPRRSTSTASNEATDDDP